MPGRHNCAASPRVKVNSAAGHLDRREPPYLDLQRRVDDPRITRSSPYTGRLYVHQFRIRAPGELDDEFAGWIHEAYQVGNGAHLGPRPHPTLAP